MDKCNIYAKRNMKKISEKLFKKVLGNFVTGITVIGIKSEEKYIGKTINSFSSLSLKPPLILLEVLWTSCIPFSETFSLFRFGKNY